MNRRQEELTEQVHALRARDADEIRRLRAIEAAARAYVAARQQWDKGTLAAATEYERLAELELALTKKVVIP